MLMRESCYQSLRTRKTWANFQPRWDFSMDVRVFKSKQNDGVDILDPPGRGTLRVGFSAEGSQG